MTFDQFMRELRESGIKFRRRVERTDDEGGVVVMIRTDDNKDECPICALHNYKFPNARVSNSFWARAAKKMDLDEELALLIINEADDFCGPFVDEDNKDHELLKAVNAGIIALTLAK